jgi:3-deoxy-D-manno-octulosonic-acid transferase
MAGLQESIDDRFYFFCAKWLPKNYYFIRKIKCSYSQAIHRFDRVAVTERQFFWNIFQFKNNTLTIVVGSSWPKDETILIDFINNNQCQIHYRATT